MILALADSFPDHVKKQKFLENLKPGSIFYLSCDFIAPPKDKYLLLLCSKPALWFFIVNSQINEFIKNKPHLLQCQISLPQAQHPFLKHDSYIACHELIDEFTLPMLEKQVLETIHLTKMISPRDKILILSQFS